MSKEYKDLVQSCKLLFDIKGSPAYGRNESFGISCHSSWIEQISDLCNKLEQINYIFYPTYKIRIVAEEIKSKFGELRFYYRIQRDQRKIKRILKTLLSKQVDLLSKVDFNLVEITDSPSFVKHEVKELLKSEWLRANSSDVKCSNVKAYEKNGKYYLEMRQDICKKTHVEANRFCLLYKYYMWCRKMVNSLECQSIDRSEIIERIIDVIDDLASFYVSEAEKKCLEVCEDCGASLLDEYGKATLACETIGWVSYICKKCAESKNSRYIYHGDLWEKDHIIQTKEKLEEQRKKSFEKYEKRSKEYFDSSKNLDSEIKSAIEEENVMLKSKQVKTLL